MSGALLTGSLAACGAAALGYSAGWRAPERKAVLRGATGLLALAFALITVLLVLRWIEADRAPFKTLHETLLVFGWCTAGITLLLERVVRLPPIGAIAALAVAGLLAYAGLRQDVEVVYLPPALQSPYFVPHVLVYFLAYALLLLAAITAVVAWLRPEARIELRGNADETKTVSYHDLMHAQLVIGFVFLTAGLLLGALWARDAWGSYWAWDPKENWALITWVTYGVYFHLRRLSWWKREWSVAYGVLSFAVVVFTYLGIHLLPTAESSIHLYQ